MQPHIQVKIIELDAACAALAVAQTLKLIRLNLNNIVRISDEMEQLVRHIFDTATLEIIVQAFERNEPALDAAIRRMKNGPR